MRTRRLVWVAILAFGGGLLALMVASLLLQRVARPAAQGDLKTAVTELRHALTEWDYEKLTECTADIARQDYQKMFDDANGGDPVRKRRFAGLLSSMDVFPSVRFTEMKPDRVDVHYEVSDGTSAARPVTSFVPREGGYFMRTAQFPIASTATTPGVDILFHEGDNLALGDAVGKLFDTLTSGSVDDFRSLMSLDPKTPAKDVMKRLDRTRALVMTYRDARLRKMVPVVGVLPRGTQWFRVVVIGEVDDKRLWLEMIVIPGDPVRFGSFKAGRMKETVSPAKPPEKPAPAQPARTPAS